MRTSYSLLFSLFLTTTAWAERFQSRVHEISEGRKKGEPHLIKFENGRVGFVKYENKADLKAFRTSKENADILELNFDNKNSFVSATTFETGTGLISEESSSSAVRSVVAYEPSVIDPVTATSVFSKMRRNYQYDSQCYNRAHIWAYEEFRRSGLKTMKLFMFFTNRYIRNYNFYWWFHVTPMAMVAETSGTVRKALDRRYTGGPRYLKNWSDVFVASNRTCPFSTYYYYRGHQESQDCYLVPVSMYFWQPKDIAYFERTGKAKTSFINSEINHAYWEAF